MRQHSRAHRWWRYHLGDYLALGVLAEVRVLSSMEGLQQLMAIYSIPGGSIIIALIIFVFPQNINQQKISRELFAQVDWPGVALSLVASVVLCFALESGGNQYSWNSAAIVASLVISGISWVAFTVWQAFLTARAGKMAMLPIFPTRLVGHRVIAAALA